MVNSKRRLAWLLVLLAMVVFAVVFESVSWLRNDDPWEPRGGARGSDAGIQSVSKVLDGPTDPHVRLRVRSATFETPIAGARIVVEGELHEVLRQFSTDESGRIDLPDTVGTAQALRVEADHHKALTISLPLPVGDESWYDVALEANPTLFVFLRDDACTMLDGWVSGGFDDSPVEQFRVASRTGAKAELRVYDLDATQTYWIEAMCAGYQKARVDGIAFRGGEGLRRVVVPMKRGVLLQGTIVHDDGTPFLAEGPAQLSLDPANSIARGTTIGRWKGAVAPDGTFGIGGLPPGCLKATVVELGRASYASLDSIMIPEGVATWRVEIRLRRNSAISGRTTDAETGEPLDDVEISVETTETRYPEAVHSLWNGEFIVNRPEGLALFLEFRKLGYSTFREFVPPSRRGPLSVSMGRSDSVSLILRVVDDRTLAPIQRYAVFLRSPEAFWFGNRRQMLRGGVSVRSEDGLYRCDRLLPGLCWLAVRAEGYFSNEGEIIELGADPETRRTVRLEAGARLSGLVVHGATDLPVQESVVSLFEDFQELNDETRFFQETTTDEGGRFTFRYAVGPGEYRLVIESTGIMDFSDTVEVAPGVDSQIIVRVGKTPVGAIHGMVSGRDGNPLPGERVVVTETSTGRRISTFTNAMGEYRVEGIAVGVAIVAVPDLERYVETKLESGRVAEVNFTLGATVRVHGVLSQGGRPFLRKAFLEMRRVDANGSSGICKAEVYADGQFEVMLTSGTWFVEGFLRWPEGTFDRFASWLVIPECEETNAVVEIGEACLFGTTLDAMGTPIAGTAIRLDLVDSEGINLRRAFTLPSLAARTMSDEHGSYRVGGLIPGVYQITARALDQGVEAQRVEQLSLSEGEQRCLDIGLRGR